MADNKQLYEKVGNDYKPINPIVALASIIDTVSDKSLEYILANYNHIYVEYKNDVATTRSEVPITLRKNGLFITYNNGKKIVTEFYKGDNTSITTGWNLDSNWELVPDLEYIFSGSPVIPSGSIVPDHLSPALKELLGSCNTIQNLPDEEDLTTDGFVLRLKDREYDEKSFTGLGRVILRKNIKVIDGKAYNILSQDMINKENTIYEIRYDFDLNGEEIAIPEGCVLDFQGGSFRNGTIVGNNTAITAGLQHIFSGDIILSGTWNRYEAYPEWFGAKKNIIVDNSEAINKALSYFDIICLSPGTYYSTHIVIPSFKTIKGAGKQSILAIYPTEEKRSGFLLTTEDGGSSITLSDFKLIGGTSNDYNDYLIGGIRLKSTSNSVNKQWDTRNTIKNIEILNCYAASLYIDDPHRGCDISNCWISGTTNVGIHCLGTDNTISECVISATHNSGIILQSNNKLCNTKLFGCGASTELKRVYALDIIGSKCAVSNIELQQNYWGGCVVKGDNNYIQIVTDNNGSGNTTDTTNVSIVGSYNTVIASCANFTFHDDAYDRYYLATDWNTVGNNIIINGKHLSNNKTAILAPYVKDNICNHIIVNGVDITNERAIQLPSYTDLIKYTSNGTGAIQTDKDGIIIKLVSSSAVNVNSLLAVIDIPIQNIDTNGVISARMRFLKEGDDEGILYPYCGIYTSYEDTDGNVKSRMENGVTISKLENGDNALLSVVTSLYHSGLNISKIRSCQLYIALRTKEIASGLEIYGYFRNIVLGVKTKDDSLCSFNPISARPNDPITGYSFLDTTLNKPIWWTGTAWVDATGAEV